jgi:hypothetical protein
MMCQNRTHQTFEVYTGGLFWVFLRKSQIKQKDYKNYIICFMLCDEYFEHLPIQNRFSNKIASNEVLARESLELE